MGLQEQDVDRLRGHLTIAEVRLREASESVRVAGNELIEAQTRMRTAQFDVHSYRRLLEAVGQAE